MFPGQYETDAAGRKRFPEEKPENFPLPQFLTGKVKRYKSYAEVVFRHGGDQVHGFQLDVRCEDCAVGKEEMLQKLPRNGSGFHADKRIGAQILYGQGMGAQPGVFRPTNQNVLEFGERVNPVAV